MGRPLILSLFSVLLYTLGLSLRVPHTRERPPLAGKVLEVVGGLKSGGILVKSGRALSSPESEQRLSTSSLVTALEQDGERLRYTLLSGSGPRDGWVSLRAKNTRLLAEVGEEGTKAFTDKEPAAAQKGKVWLMTQGSRGDVQPIIALGVAMMKVGFQVRMFVSSNFKDFVESYGILFTEFGENAQAMVDEKRRTWSPDEVEKEETEADLEETFCSEATVRKNARTVVDLLNLETPDLVVSFLQLCGIAPIIAWKKSGVPVVNFYYTPHALVLGLEDVKEKIEKWKEKDAKWIENEVGINPLEDCDSNECIDLLFNRSIAFVSPSCLDVFSDDEVAKAAESLELIREKCKGFLHLGRALRMKDLRSFGGFDTLSKIQHYLDAGTPPAYVGWGSIPVPTVVLLKLLVVMRMLQMRVIVCAGWGAHNLETVMETLESTMPGDPMGLRPYISDLCYVDVAPHDWLFPRCCLTVHHGGAGTTYAAVRAGVPTIVMPVAIDQYFWADWVIQLGIGEKIMMRENTNKLMDQTWATVIRKAAADADMIAKAKSFGEIARSEDSAAEAAETLSKLVLHSRGEQQDT